MELTWIGNIYGCGSGYAGNVWGVDGLSPALMTMGGGNRQPMVIENYEEDNDRDTDQGEERGGEDEETPSRRQGGEIQRGQGIQDRPRTGDRDGDNNGDKGLVID